MAKFPGWSKEIDAKDVIGQDAVAQYFKRLFIPVPTIIAVEAN